LGLRTVEAQTDLLIQALNAVAVEEVGIEASDHAGKGEQA